MDSQHADRFSEILHFIAADSSGSFGLLAGHARMVAVLRQGLARFLDAQGQWHYVALPGGVLSFDCNRLTVMSVRYFLGTQRELILNQLAEAMAQSDSDIRRSKSSMEEIEHSLIRRLSELSGSKSEAMTS
jgi:F-type H+-transporting ATPase subunit epsilon